MAQAIILPKLGNTVESSIILSWHVNVGEPVAEGDILCEIETDKATLEVESTASGILLARFYDEGDDVPVLETIAVVGQADESYAEFKPATSEASRPIESSSDKTPTPQPTTRNGASTEKTFISPRAKQLATRKNIDYSHLVGTGPNGRIIERDIESAIVNQMKVSPVAKAMLNSGEFAIGDGLSTGNRITKTNLVPALQQNRSLATEVKEIPLKGIRQTIAKRMLESLQTTAQLTLHSSADATALLAFRKRLKASDKVLGLQHISINDLVMYAVVQTLPHFAELNALFENETIYQHQATHLGLAVDTPRGLFVPVIHHANTYSLKHLSAEAHRLAQASLDRKIKPEEMAGGTFTVTNLGALGIESFTPILNLPQVAILGVSNINLKPIQQDDEVVFSPHMGLSLTVNHQVVDGALGARFLRHLAKTLADIDLILAL